MTKLNGLNLFFSWLIAVSSLILMSACGGGSSSSDDEGPADILDPSDLEISEPAALAAIVDSVITGIAYSTASSTGFTDFRGTFPFVEGEIVTFSIGDITLPAITVKKTITPLDLFSTNDINDPRVVNFSRLVQTLDTDGDPSNGISIGENAHAAASGLSLQFDSASFDTDVAFLVQNSGSVNSTLVSEADALQHLESTLELLPASGEYFEVYGAMAGDYAFTTSNRDLLGTSNGGLVFDVRGYERFIIYVPPSSGRIYFDVISFSGEAILEGDNKEFIFAPGGSLSGELVHRVANFNVTAVKGLNAWGGIEAICEIGVTIGQDCSGWWPVFLPVESAYFGETIHNTPGKPSYYSFSTGGADFMRIQTMPGEIFDVPLSCGYSTPFVSPDPAFSAYLTPNTFSEFMTVVSDCTEQPDTVANDMPGTWRVLVREGGFTRQVDYTFNNDGTGEFLDSDAFEGAIPTPITWSAENGIVRLNWRALDTSELVTVNFWAITSTGITIYTESIVNSDFIYHVEKFGINGSGSSFLTPDFTTFDDPDGTIWTGGYTKL